MSSHKIIEDWGSFKHFQVQVLVRCLNSLEDTPGPGRVLHKHLSQECSRQGDFFLSVNKNILPFNLPLAALNLPSQPL